MQLKHHQRTVKACGSALIKPETAAALLALGLAVLPTVSRADATWVGGAAGSAQDWNNATNWSSAPASPTGNFTINSNLAGAFPILGADSVFSPNDIIIGAGAGNTGRLDHTSGTLSAGTGNWTYVGFDGGVGVYNITGGALNTADFRMAANFTGDAVTNVATVNVSNATLNVGGILFCSRGNSVGQSARGTMNVYNGGVVNIENDLVVMFAGDPDSSSEMNINSGATVSVATTTYRWLIVSQWDPNTKGRLNVNGGTLNLNAGTDIRFSIGNSTGESSVTVSNGGVINGSFRPDNGIPSVLVFNGGSGTPNNNSFNLAGGTLRIGQILAGNAVGTRVFNFNGGTLKPLTNQASFFPADTVTTANVLPGGAIIDTTNFNITIGQTLTGSGGLTKLGSGTLSLPAANSYTGPTVVREGTLNIDATLYPTYGNMVVSNGTALGLSLNNGTGYMQAGNMSFNGNTALNVNYGNAAMPAPAVYATGVSSSGTTTINISGTSLTAGQYPIFSTGGSVPTNGFVLGSLPTGVVAVLVNSGTSLDLLVTASGQNLTWYGANSGGTPLTTWNINSSSNWNFGANVYKEYGSYGDNVTFDDSVFSGSTNVTLSTRVVPTTVTVSSFGQSYAITGGGGIDGATSLLITNTGSLFLGTSNNYTGGTFIAGGTLIITNDSALGTNTASATLAGGTLQLAGNNTFSRAIEVSSESTLNIPSGNTVQYTGSMTGGSGVTKAGDGLLNLPAPNAISVAATVSAGLIRLSDANAVSNGTIGLGVDNGLTFNTGIGSFNVGGLSGALGLALADTGATPVTLIVGTNNANSTYEGPLTGAGSLVKVGTGTLRLNGISTYSGGSTVSGGALTAQAGLLAGLITPFGSGLITVSNGAQLELGGAPSDAFGSYSYANNVVLDNGKILAWDASHRVLGNVSIAAGGGALGSTFDAPWENFAEANFPKSLFIDGLLTGSGSLTIQHPGWATGNQWNTSCVVFTNQGAGNTYSGAVTVNPLTIGSSGGSYLYLASTNVMANATITLTGNNSPANGRMGISTLLFGNGNVDGPGYCTIGGLAGSGSLLLADTILFTGGTGYSNGIPVALTVGYNNSSTTYSGAMFGAGSLIKMGSGTLTLTGANSYAGNTTILGGSLELGQSIATLATNSTVSIAAGATLNLSVGGAINRVASLVTNGVPVADGVYGSANSGGFIVGPGSLVVGAAVPPPSPVHLTNSYSTGSLSLSWPAGQGWKLQMQTNGLSVGLSNNWVTITDGSGSSTNITVDASKPTSFFRLVYP